MLVIPQLEYSPIMISIKNSSSTLEFITPIHSSSYLIRELNKLEEEPFESIFLSEYKNLFNENFKNIFLANNGKVYDESKIKILEIVR